MQPDERLQTKCLLSLLAEQTTTAAEEPELEVCSLQPYLSLSLSLHCLLGLYRLLPRYRIKL